MVERNILANLVGRIWGIASVYLFVPLYLNFLGFEAYGLVGFYSTLLALLAFADVGLTATLNRELARLCIDPARVQEMGSVVRTYEAAYLCISSVIAAALCILAPLIASNWLRSTSLSAPDLILAIRLMGAAIALQLPAGLYIGGLMGLQDQVRANCLQIGWGFLRGVGAILILWLVAPTIVAFAAWQLVSNLIYCYSSRQQLWRLVSSRSRTRVAFQWPLLTRSWRYAAGMTAMSAISTLLTQSDKLVVSKMLPLQTFGFYSLAATVASVPTLFAGPVATAVFPYLTGLVVSEDHHGLARLYTRACQLVALSIVPAALTLMFFSSDFIAAWTGSPEAAVQTRAACICLLSGQLIQGLLVVPYYLALAHGIVRYNIRLGLASVATVIPLLVLLTNRYGILGSGVAWLILNLCILPIYTYLVHKHFPVGKLLSWWKSAVLLPIITTLPWVVVGACLAPRGMSRVGTFFVMALVWTGATLSTAGALPESRIIIVGYLKRGADRWRLRPSSP